MGKTLNPADAQRKAERKREVKKNKEARSTVRSEKLFASPAALREELEKWKKLRPGEKGEDGERLDPASIANRVKRLEAAYATLLRTKRVSPRARAAPPPSPALTYPRAGGRRKSGQGGRLAPGRAAQCAAV
jgi:hypothetical protein